MKHGTRVVQPFANDLTVDHLHLHLGFRGLTHSAYLYLIGWIKGQKYNIEGTINVVSILDSYCINIDFCYS
jgi:hypothetical protein